MTILQVNDREAESVINRYGQAVIIEYIRAFKPREEFEKNNLANKLQVLKNTKFKRKGKLQEAFSSLNSKIKNLDELNNINIDKVKKEYFDKKYQL